MENVNLEEIKKLTHDLREAADQKNKEAESQILAEMKSVDGKIEAQNAEIKAQKEASEAVEKKLAEIEADLKRSSGIIASEKQEEAKKHMSAFETFLKKGHHEFSMSHREELKYLRTDNNVDGGFLAPEEYANEIIKKIVPFSPMRQYANIVTTSRSAYEIPKRDTLVAGYWVGEGQAVTASNSQYGKITIAPGKMGAKVSITREMLTDAVFNMRDQIIDNVATRFRALEGAAYINGNGINKPEGITVATGLTEVNSGNAATISADAIIAARTAVLFDYDRNGAYMMNRDTLGKVRQLKDNQGRYLLNDGINGPEREMELNGRPVVIADDLPNEAANAFPIFYGDFRAGYTIVDNAGLYTKEDSSTLADQDMTSYLFFRRTGGKVVLPEALVKIKCAV